MDERVEYSQDAPRLGNPMLEDTALQRYLEALLRDCKRKSSIQNDLTRFGDKCSGPYLKMAANAERFKPMLERYDQWGKRLDVIHTSEGWKYFKKQSAEEGLVSIAYEEADEFARIHQAVKLICFEASSGMFGCPLAMTDGAAYLIKRLISGDKELAAPTLEKLKSAYSHLTSRDPEWFWTSGQWFTEKHGGSDLARATQTQAVVASRDSLYQLYGYKWFTSAVDADMTLTLASIDDRVGPMSPDRKPLSLFYLETRKEVLDNEGESYNSIKVVRLKDKMATRQLPTAELVLEGSVAHLLSKPGQGIKTVLPMLVITRWHNSLTAVSFSLRLRNLAVDFAHVRKAFGSPIIEKPLHMQTLTEYDFDVKGSLLMVLEFSRLLGLSDQGIASSQEEAFLRIMSSLCKVFTALECVRLAREGVELFGAVGVMENSISMLFRDAQVLPIWEGTSNTLSLDLLRFVTHEPSGVVSLKKTLTEYGKGDERINEHIGRVFGFFESEKLDLEWFEFNAKRLTLNLSRLVVASVCMKTYSATQVKEDYYLSMHWLDRLDDEFQKIRDPKSLKSAVRTDLQSMNGKSKDSRGKVRSSL